MMVIQYKMKHLNTPRKGFSLVFLNSQIFFGYHLATLHGWIFFHLEMKKKAKYIKYFKIL